MSRLDREQDSWWKTHGQARLADSTQGAAGAGVEGSGRGLAPGDGDAPSAPTRGLTTQPSLLLAREGITDVGYLRMVLGAYDDADVVQLTGELRAL